MFLCSNIGQHNSPESQPFGMVKQHDFRGWPQFAAQQVVLQFGHVAWAGRAGRAEGDGRRWWHGLIG